MKFSESLKYNAVPEWKQYYLDYSGLKRLIYKLQKQQLNNTDTNSNNDDSNSISGSEIEDDFVNLDHRNIDDLDDSIDYDYDELDLEQYGITEDQLHRLSLILQDLLKESSIVVEHGTTADFSNLTFQNSNDSNDDVQTVDMENANTTTEETGSASAEHSGKGKSRFLSKFTNKISVLEKNNTDMESGFEETIELEDINSPPNGSSSSSSPPASSSHSKFHKLSLPKKKLKFAKNLRFSSKNKSTADSDQESTTSSQQDIHAEFIFMKKILYQMLKIDNFYKKTETDLDLNFDTLYMDIEKSKSHSKSAHPSRRPSVYSASLKQQPTTTTTTTTTATTTSGFETFERPQDPFSDDDDEDDLEEGLYDEDVMHSDEEHTALLSSDDLNINSQKKAILKKATINLYVDMTQLKSFAELNKIGFLKICKKFDKTCNCQTKKRFIESNELFDKTFTYKSTTISDLQLKINKLIEFFALINNLTFEQSKTEMRSYLRDYIVWERSTVWKDMLGLESSKFNNSKNEQFIKQDDLAQLESENSHLHLPLRKLPIWKTNRHIYIPEFLFTWRTIKLSFIITFTVILLCVETFHDPVQHRCIALLECVALLWATEALPLFVTAIMIPFLETVMLVFKDSKTGEALSAANAASTAFSAMWSSTIMVLLAGFTLAAALSKYNVAKVLASYLLSLAGKKPRNVLLMIMGVVFFLSMWISNVASPVLTYSLSQPVLRTLNADAPFAKALVLGVALSANIGGMASPISSPQNVFSQTYLKPYGVGWGQFFAVALPTGILAMLLIWIELCLTYKINQNKIQKFKPIKEKFTLKQWYVIFVTLATILLWCFLTDMEFFGNAGVIGVIPIVLLFGSGLLNGEDLNNFPWSIVILAMGGIALGSGINSSGLLNTIGTSLQKRVQDYSMFAILAIFGIIMLVFGTFVSHTVAAIIIVPLVQEVGDKLPDPQAAPILVFGCTLLASCGMGLASSGFPNITAFGKTDSRGKQYLTVNSFMSRGIPASFLGYISIITLGYGIMKSIL
ncbi:hypothetical protein ACO0QE_002172 [Hanseniaspora vineae]